MINFAYGSITIKYRDILEKACSLAGKKQVISSSISQFEPLYDLKKVMIKPIEGSSLFDSRNYVVNPGSALPLDNIVLLGKDRDNWDFFGFDQNQMGHWIPCNEKGESRTQTEADTARLTEKEPGKGQRIIAADKVDKSKIYWFKWVLNDNLAVTSNESPGGIDHSKVELPLLSVKVLANSSIEDYDTVKLEGTYSGSCSETVSLPKVLTVTNSKKKDIPVYWESGDSSGSKIKVNEESGEVSFAEPGSYKVRAYCISNNDTCTKCGFEKTEKAAHKWSEPTYTPDDKYDNVTAERHCLHEGCIKETETAEIQVDSSVSGGIWTVVYHAAFKNPAFKEWKVTDQYEGEQGAKLPGVLKAKGKTVKIKASKLKKKAVKIKGKTAIKISASAGKLSYKKVSLTPKKYKSYFTVNQRNGMITVKKKLKKGTYKLKIKVTASGDKTHEKKAKNVICKIVVR